MKDDIKLTRKQKALADKVIANPKASATSLVKEVYNVAPHNADSLASQVLRKPQVLAYLEKHSDLAEKTIVGVLRNSRKRKGDMTAQRLAKDSAEAILDRVHGKPTQRTELSGSFLTVSIDMNGE